ncbi:MAG TPA: alpha/beta fold hydrolase, partial [Ilumatobacteraceae bacterium]|nr:alpha/beta fold hydrolase [Ilumatobacteraceae bacterium]
HHCSSFVHAAGIDWHVQISGRGPLLLLLHGAGASTHTWRDLLPLLAKKFTVVAIDLPGHGHSGWRADGAYSPMNMADDLAVVIAELAPTARVVVGMSLGGMTAMELAVRHPTLVASLVMVDITPGVNAAKTKAVTDFVDGPQSFASFDDLLARTTEFNPTRSESSLRRGILHNARQLPDGSWAWRYDRGSRERSNAGSPPAVGDADVVAPAAPSDDRLSPMWDHFEAIGCPIMLVRGSLSPVVDDDDVAEACRRQPDLVVEVVDGAGHSVQGDRPVELAGLLDRWLR